MKIDLGVAVLIGVLSIFPLMAQTTGRMEGVVEDPAGLPVPGVQLRITSTGTGAERIISTDERGWYLAPNLAPGAYEIVVSRSGFRKEVRRGTALSAGRSIRIDFRLQVGPEEQTVVVNASASPVSSAPGDWGGSIERVRLETLPLNGRDVFDLLVQQPGVTIATTAMKSMTTGSGIRISVNGARPNQNSFRMDGIYVNDATSSTPSSAAGRLLGLESIDELRIIASPFDAEYGRAAGAVVTAVSKSGTNQWHGSAYEFLRNSALDAKNFFDSPNEEIPPRSKNQFGGLISGPLRLNSLFMLLNYEGVRESSSKTMYSVTPTADAREGRLPGGTVTVDPAVVPYLDLYPLPNGQDYGDGTGEYITRGDADSREDNVTAKLDVIFSNRLRQAVRYTFDDAITFRPESLNIHKFIDDSHYHFLHSETLFSQSAHTLHNFRAGFSRVYNNQTFKQPDSITPEMSFVPGELMGNIGFTAGLTGIGGRSGDNISLLPRRFITNDFQVSYTFTQIRGAHVLRAGGAFNRVQFNQRSENSGKGTYTFSGLPDFLQAIARSGDLMMPGSDTIRGWRQSLYFGFFQDEFRAGPRLNLTMGLRYEGYTTPTEVNDKISTLRNPVNDTSVTIGEPLFKNPSATNFAPRVSLAWDPFGSGKTVIRAGAGIFFDLLSTRELVIAGVRMPPFFDELSLNAPSFPDLYEAALGAPPVNSIDMLDYDLPQPYVLQYQLMVQRELARDTVLHFGYVGTRGVHLPGMVDDINPTRPEVLPDGRLYFPESMVRINTAFSRIRGRRTQFDSTYHGFQASLDRHFRQGFGFQVKYTWSKSLDNATMVIRNDYLNSSKFPTMFDYSQNRGRSDFDLRHVFAGNFSWTLPEWKKGPLNKVLGGWQLHGT
ncbi:MAG: outer rane receptor protein, partial [Acidobacteria bacterium]|nr:outer rane receptor protein [Acidobacteriota bacterium]